MRVSSFPRYESYQPAASAWLGEVPSHWALLPGLAVLKENKHKNIGMVEKTVLSLSYGKVIIKPPEKLTGLVPESFETYQVIHPNDIIIRPTDLQNDHTSLRTGLANDKGIITSAYICLRPMAAHNPRFVHYLLHAYDLMKVFYGMGSGLRQNLDYRDFKRLELCLPPRDEQDRIANFLDQKTAEIDEAIAKKQHLIELLKEHKAILINQAVTKGLNLDVPMRDSGVEWIGEVPEHWETKRLKYLIDFLPGFAFKSDQYSPDDAGVPLLRGININPGQLNWQEVMYWPKEKASRYEQYKLHEGDYVIGMDRPWVNDGIRVARVGLSDVPCLLLQRVGRIRAREGLVDGYMGLLLRSEGFLAYFEPMLSGISVPHISPEQIKNFSSAFPPESEQLAIADYCQRMATEFDELVSKEMNAIQAIQEYKSVLIANAVTGRIKL